MLPLPPRRLAGAVHARRGVRARLRRGARRTDVPRERARQHPLHREAPGPTRGEPRALGALRRLPPARAARPAVPADRALARAADRFPSCSKRGDRPRAHTSRRCSSHSGSRGCCRSTGSGLFLRLGAATLVVLLPGRLIARALGLRSTSATLAWALAAVGVGARRRLRRALVVRARAPGHARHRRCGARLVPGRIAPAAAALGRHAVGAAGSCSACCSGTSRRARSSATRLSTSRACASSSSSARSRPWRLDELVGGGLHPGYAFPLWHAFLAAVTKVAGVDPALVVQHESSLLVPLAVLVAFEAGLALFNSRGARRRDRGGAGRDRRASQRATAGRTRCSRGPRRRRGSCSCRPCSRSSSRTSASLGAACSCPPASPRSALALVHPTYAVFLCLPLAGWLFVDALAEGRRAWRIAAGLAAVAVPTGAVGLALLPLARDTVSHAPSMDALQQSLVHYRDQLVVNGGELPPRPGGVRAQRRRRRRRARRSCRSPRSRGAVAGRRSSSAARSRCSPPCSCRSSSSTSRMPSSM